MTNRNTKMRFHLHVLCVFEACEFASGMIQRRLNELRPRQTLASCFYSWWLKTISRHMHSWHTDIYVWSAWRDWLPIRCCFVCFILSSIGHRSEGISTPFHLSTVCACANASTGYETTHECMTPVLKIW